jgi:hypothetical protein
MFKANILFLKNIFISQIGSADDLAENYFTRSLNSKSVVEAYGKVPDTYSSLDDYCVQNIMCFNTNIMLNGPHKHPFIPTSMRKCNTLLFDSLNKLNIKKGQIVPVKEEAKGQEYFEMKCFGVFYDFNVALNFIHRSDWTAQIKWERSHLLGVLYQHWYKKPMTCLGIIADKYMMKQFGGPLTTEEYIEELTG